jgi:hypothetical protein
MDRRQHVGHADIGVPDAHRSADQPGDREHRARRRAGGPGGRRKSLWVGIHDPSGGPERVLTVDPTTNSITTTWRLARGMDRLSFVDGTLWAGSGGGVPRVASIDPANGQLIGVQEHGLPETSAGGDLWATADGAARIDPEDGSTVATVGAGNVDQVAAGLGAVWALTRTSPRARTVSAEGSKPATVVAIDPATNRIVGAPVPIGTSPAHMTVGAGAVWVAQYDSGLVTRVELH